MTERIAEQLVELAKRRGFFFQASDAYGGVAGFYTFGPHGATLKRNIEDAWRDRFAIAAGHQEVDAPTVMPEPVFEASGHLDGFDDMLVECPNCGQSHRADHLIEDATELEDAEALPTEQAETLIETHDLTCPTCGATLAGQPVEQFNLMFGTNIGPGSSAPGYLRPETAQGIFVEFPRLKEYARGKLPFGVTQIGRAYRNEISPRRSIIRVREFTQAELELFIDPERDQPDLATVGDVSLSLYPIDQQESEDGKVLDRTVEEAVAEGLIESEWIAYYLGVARQWYAAIGVDMERFRFRQHLPGERAHYATDCWDAEAYVAGDWVELSGFSTRGSYDLRRHDEHSDESFTVFRQYDEPITKTQPTVDPDMSALGPAFGSAATAIANALEKRAQQEPEAFQSGTSISVDVDGEIYTVPIEHTGFEITEVTEAGEHIYPEVIEPSFGIDRIVYTILEHAYQQDEVDGEQRTYLSLPPAIAPTTVGVFPLVDNDGLPERATEIVTELREAGLAVTYDESGAIGRRYRRQDEIGTPFCVTIDHDTLEEETVTIRDRDSTAQVRVPTAELTRILRDLRDGLVHFEELT